MGFHHLHTKFDDPRCQRTSPGVEQLLVDGVVQGPRGQRRKTFSAPQGGTPPLMFVALYTPINYRYKNDITSVQGGDPR